MATATLEAKSRITARVPTSIQLVLEQAAAYLGVPLNSFVVTAAVEKANELLAAERAIQLGRKDAELFAKLLENPPAPSPALLEAGKAYQEMIRE
jgi:uncharacterized protein (DUF1778 family)